MGRRSTEQIALEQIKDFHLDLRGVGLSSANLTASHFAKVDFRTSDLQRADLVNASLLSASLQATKSTVTPVFAMPTAHTPVLGQSICQAQTFPKPKSTKCLRRVGHPVRPILPFLQFWPHRFWPRPFPPSPLAGSHLGPSAILSRTTKMARRSQNLYPATAPR